MHDKKDVKNVGHPNVIFGKYKDNVTFTKEAILYQNILQYSINGEYKEEDNESFRLWNLTKRLLEVNPELMNHYKDLSTRNTKKSSRVEKFKPRVKRYVEELVNMGLVRQVGTAKETKGTGSVDIFQFTIIGRVVAWIVESLNPDKREYAVNGLYNLLQSHYSKKISSINMFNSIYHRKCKENGLFGIIIDYHRELLESGLLAIDKRGFSQQLTIQPVYSIGNNFWTLWNDSAMELDVPTRLKVFHHLKLQIERKAEDECQGFGGFEELRYKSKDIPASVII